MVGKTSNPVDSNRSHNNDRRRINSSRQGIISAIPLILTTTSRSRMSKFCSKKAKATVGDQVITFDSTVERDRYLHLKLLERAGEIHNLEIQVPYQLLPAQEGERGVKYIADFKYQQDGKTVVEDTKSAITKKQPDYILKRKMMLFFHGIKIKQIERKQGVWVYPK